MNKGTTPSGAQQDNEQETEPERDEVDEDEVGEEARSLPLIKCAKSKKECAQWAARVNERRSGSYRRLRVLIVLNNCTTMGPKYVDRKVMKASRAKPGNRNERRRRKEEEKEERGEEV